MNPQDKLVSAEQVLALLAKWPATYERDMFIREISDLPASNAWRDIAEAPKDGTPVFITANYGVKEDGKLFGSVPVCAVWANNGFYVGWATPDLSQVYGEMTQRVTHWQPLPPAPANVEGDGR